MGCGCTLSSSTFNGQRDKKKCVWNANVHLLCSTCFVWVRFEQKKWENLNSSNVCCHLAAAPTPSILLPFSVGRLDVVVRSPRLNCLKSNKHDLSDHWLCETVWTDRHPVRKHNAGQCKCVCVCVLATFEYIYMLLITSKEHTHNGMQTVSSPIEHFVRLWQQKRIDR